MSAGDADGRSPPGWLPKVLAVGAVLAVGVYLALFWSPSFGGTPPEEPTTTPPATTEEVVTTTSTTPATTSNTVADTVTPGSGPPPGGTKGPFRFVYDPATRNVTVTYVGNQTIEPGDEIAGVTPKGLQVNVSRVPVTLWRLPIEPGDSIRVPAEPGDTVRVYALGSNGGTIPLAEFEVEASSAG